MQNKSRRRATMTNPSPIHQHSPLSAARSEVTVSNLPKTTSGMTNLTIMSVFPRRLQSILETPLRKDICVPSLRAKLDVQDSSQVRPVVSGPSSIKFTDDVLAPLSSSFCTRFHATVHGSENILDSTNNTFNRLEPSSVPCDTDLIIGSFPMLSHGAYTTTPMPDQPQTAQPMSSKEKGTPLTTLDFLDDDEAETSKPNDSIASIFRRPLHFQDTTSSIKNCQLAAKTVIARPKLSLSAFRKPEAAVRLTSAPPYRLLLDHYDFHPTNSRVLGHGASSTVRLATHRAHPNNRVAVKCIAKHDVLRNHTSYRRSKREYRLDECDILTTLNSDYHSGIVKLLDVFETDSEVQLVMEYCAGGELFDAIHRRRNSKAITFKQGMLRGKRKSMRPLGVGGTALGSFSVDEDDIFASGSGFTELHVANFAFQLLSALAHLHRRGIVHRDVKPENVLLASDDDNDLRVKLSDFGLARVLHNPSSQQDYDSSSSVSVGDASPLTPPSVQRSRVYSRVGSDYYAAPEVGTGKGYDTAVDVYSLGATLYVLLCGFPPAQRTRCGSNILDEDSSASSDSSDNENCFKNTPAPVEFPSTHWRGISISAKNLVKKMLHPDPARRVTAVDALSHEWIVQCHRKDTILDRPTYFESSPTKPVALAKLSPACLSPAFNLGYTLASKLFEYTTKTSDVNEGSSYSRKRRRSFVETLPPMPPPQHNATLFSVATLSNHVSIVASSGSNSSVAGLLDAGANVDNGIIVNGGNETPVNSELPSFPTTMMALSV